MSLRTPVTAGIDGSPESLTAADEAAREALLRDLPLHLVHVFDQPSQRTRLPEIEVPFHRESGALDRAVLKISDTYPALGIIDEQVTGPPVEALLAAAETSALLAVGSRGFGSVTGALIGSVALAVAARATCPVLLVRAGEEAPKARQGPAAGPYAPVLMGLDLNHPCDELLEFAFLAATLRDAPLHVMHTWTHPLGPSTDATAPAVTKSHLLTSALAPWQHKFPGTRVIERLVHGAAGHHLVNAASTASLLVLGRPISAGPRLGATAHKAIHRATCAVAIVPHA
ncbi:universal stress protein [Streptomyces sp. SYP-A7185]|uniref:universal stress protein n=1 Tax=Streptomyces sp. SYP-A7185 TaxID=3040076 RepID=UPI0038F81255